MCENACKPWWIVAIVPLIIFTHFPIGLSLLISNTVEPRYKEVGYNKTLL